MDAPSHRASESPTRPSCPSPVDAPDPTRPRPATAAPTWAASRSPASPAGASLGAGVRRRDLDRPRVCSAGRRRRRRIGPGRPAAADNAGLASEVDGLERELDLVRPQALIQLEARAHGLGTRGERPFTIDPNATALPADAPGSAAVGSAPDR